MEYIEQKPPVVKPHQKRNKIILWSLVSALVVTAIVLTYYFTISKIFLNYENISLFTFSYRYDIDGDGVCIESVKEDELPAKLRIPEKLEGRPVVEIADNVFSQNGYLEEVIFPSTLKKIGNNCFDGCSNLKKFNVPDSLVEIGTDAFRNTAWLDSQGDGEVTIGSMLYTYNGEMEYPAAIVESEDSVSSSKYKTIVNLGKYKSMSSGVFKGQSNLVYVEIPENFKTVKESTFEDCEQLEQVVLHDSLEKIEASAFANCSELDQIKVPENVTYIGDNALSNTLITGEINLHDGLTYLGSGAFTDCVNISKVTFPNNFANINDYLFEGCTSLTEVVFPNNEYTVNSTISYIGVNAFAGTAISEFKVPFNVSSIQQSAFSDCPNLKTVYVYNNTTNSKEIYYIEDEETGETSFVVSDSYQGIISFGKNLFMNSSSFEEMLLVDKDNKVTSNTGEVSIPVTVSVLGSSSQEANFFSGTAVKTLNLFQDLQGISDFDYKETLSYTLIKTLPPTFAQDALKLETVNFGSDDQASIQTINRAAFKNCVSLKSVNLPNTVTTLQTNCFENCTSLASVSLSKNINAIPVRSFANCSSLKTIEIPSLYCKTLGAEAFLNCTSLESVTFDNENGSLTNIGQSAFKGCSSLKSFTISASCESLSNDIFSGCTSLSTVEFSTNSKVTAIPANLFEGNTSLVKIILPSSVKTINANAFKNSGLKEIYLNSAEVVTVADNSFEGTNLEGVYVLETLVDEYKNNSNWSKYASIIKAIS